MTNDKLLAYGSYNLSWQPRILSGMDRPRDLLRTRAFALLIEIRRLRRDRGNLSSVTCHLSFVIAAKQQPSEFRLVHSLATPRHRLRHGHADREIQKARPKDRKRRLLPEEIPRIQEPRSRSHSRI